MVNFFAALRLCPRGVKDVHDMLVSPAPQRWVLCFAIANATNLCSAGKHDAAVDTSVMLPLANYVCCIHGCSFLLHAFLTLEVRCASADQCCNKLGSRGRDWHFHPHASVGVSEA